jgi:hypothetical protein
MTVAIETLNQQQLEQINITLKLAKYCILSEINPVKSYTGTKQRPIMLAATLSELLVAIDRLTAPKDFH